MVLILDIISTIRLLVAEKLIQKNIKNAEAFETKISISTITIMRILRFLGNWDYPSTTVTTAAWRAKESTRRSWQSMLQFRLRLIGVCPPTPLTISKRKDFRRQRSISPVI